jgi:hypothetical protein
MGIEEVALVTGHREWKTLQRYARLRAEGVVTRYPARTAPATPVSPLSDTPRRNRT